MPEEQYEDPQAPIEPAPLDLKSAAARSAARGVLRKSGGPITELGYQLYDKLWDPPALGGARYPDLLPAGSRSSTERGRTRFQTSVLTDIPPVIGEFDPALKVSPDASVRAEKRRRRLETHQQRLEKNPDAEMPGAQKNASVALQPKMGVMLPQVRIGQQSTEDWIARVESLLSTQKILDASKWYRSGMMLDPFLRSVGPEKTPEMLSGTLVASQQASPSQAIRATLKIKEQLRRGLTPADPEWEQTGTADPALVPLLEGKPIKTGAGQKIHDFYDAAMQNPTRTYYNNEADAGAPFVVDVHTGRDMGYVDNVYKRFLEKNYIIPENVDILVDQPKGGWSETQYENAAQEGRQLTNELNEMGWAAQHGIEGELSPADVQAIGWIAMSDLYGAPGEDIPEAIEKNIQRVSAELGFGEGAPYNELFPEYAELTPEQQFEVTRKAMSWVADVANKIAGTLNIGRVHGSGGWQSYPPAPSMVENLLATPEGADLYADIVGYLAQQTEVWAVKPVTRGSADANGIAVDIFETGGTQKITEGGNLQEVWNTVNELNPGLFQGFQPLLKGGKPGIRLIIATPALAAETGNVDLIRYMRRTTPEDAWPVFPKGKSQDPEYTKRLLDAFQKPPGVITKPTPVSPFTTPEGSPDPEYTKRLLESFKQKQKPFKRSQTYPAQQVTWQKSIPKGIREYLDANNERIQDSLDAVFPDIQGIPPIEFDIAVEDVSVRVRKNDWKKDNNGESYLLRIQAAGGAGKESVDRLRDRHRSEFETFLKSVISQVQSRISSGGAPPDWAILNRALPKRQGLTFPADAASITFEDALKDYESAKDVIPPILDPKKRQHNFDRWWTWDFQNDKPGKEPSVITEGYLKDGPYSEDKEPLVLYHGSPRFAGTKFDPETAQTRDHGWWGEGFYFTNDKDLASSYAERLEGGEVATDFSGPVAKVYSVDSKGKLGEILEEVNFEHSGFQKSGYPETADGLRQYAEEQYEDSMAEVLMKESELGAMPFSPELIPVYVNMKNPFLYRYLDVDDLQKLEEVVGKSMTKTERSRMVSRARAGMTRELEQHIRNWADGMDIGVSDLLSAAGYDGAVFEHSGLPGAYDDEPSFEVIVFDPKQIKSATGNIGLFNPRSDDFLTQLEQKKTKQNQQIAQIMAQQQMRQSAA